MPHTPPHRMQQTVRLRADAPDKPPFGAHCNGCGVCCAAEPCALGTLLYLQRSGACPALRWDDGVRAYRCGLVSAPTNRLGWLPRCAEPLFSRWAARWIGAGTGCDSDAQIE